MTLYTNDPANKPQDKIPYIQRSVEQLRTSNKSLFHGILMLRFLGYGLLVLALLDLVSVLVPFNFMNPVWELQITGELIERVPVPLIGLTLVFLGKQEQRSRWEFPLLLKFFSLVALLSAVLMLLISPLIIVNTFRINDSLTAQIRTQASTRKDQIQQVKEQVNKVNTIEDMKVLISNLDSRGRTPKIQDPQSLTEMKEQLSESIDKGTVSIRVQENKALSAQRKPLFKNAVKWTLGALVSCVLFINIWLWSRSVW